MSDKAKAYAVSKVCKHTERFTAGPSGQYYALMIEDNRNHIDVVH